MIMKVSRSLRRRVYRIAAEHWLASRPHAAWATFDRAGLLDEWPTFQRVALRRARRTFLARMSD